METNNDSEKGNERNNMTPTIQVDALADVHTHLREGDIVPHLIFLAIAGGADVLGAMPNTTNGLTTAEQVRRYIQQAQLMVFRHEPPVSFMPFVMVTEKTTEQDIDECIKAGILDAKVYPHMRTTKSTNGVIRYGRILPIIKHCGAVGMKCHFHPEHPSMLFSNRDAEFAFLPLVRLFLEESNAIIVWEHGTDARCIPHWEDMARSDRFGLTLTAHHLATNEDLTFGDVRATCKPPIKLESDRVGLVELVTRNHDWVMAGGDVAYHDKSAKHTDHERCACGAYTGPFLLPLYAHALDHLLQDAKGYEVFVNFTSRNARKFHDLPASSRMIRLIRRPWKIPLSYSVGNGTALPFWAGQTLNWQIES